MQVDLLHVLALHAEVQRAVVGLGDEQRELLHVAQDLLADALAGAVDAISTPGHANSIAAQNIDR